jgi:hypothetical protein
VTYPRWPEEHEAKLRRLKRQGLSVPELADALPYSRSAILGKLWRLGLSAKPGGEPLAISPEERPTRVRPGARVTLPPLASLS